MRYSEKIAAFLAVLILVAPSLAVEFNEELISTPVQWGESLTKELEAKFAYNQDTLFMRFEWNDKTPNIFYDLLIYQNGTWVRNGPTHGQNKDGITEDRITLMIDDGSVRGFKTFGCYVTCHADLRHVYGTPAQEELSKHPFLGKKEDVRKYIPESRRGAEWYEGTWKDIAAEDKAKIDTLLNNGVFLDMLMWRSVRGNPIGWADDLYVLEYRNTDKGKSMFTANWNSTTKQPNYMFDEKKVGFAALRWDDIKAGKITQKDVYYLSKDTATKFDPGRQWKEGDVIPRIYLQAPDGSRGDIVSSGTWSNGKWIVTMQRKLNTGNPDDKVFKEGRTYYVGFAVHDHATESRWHYVSLPYALGMGTRGDIVAQKVSGEPNWDAVQGTKVELYYPGETTWEWLTSVEHPGSKAVKTDTVVCAACHGSAKELAKRTYGLEMTHSLESARASTWAAGVILLFGISAVGIILRRR